MRSPGKYAAWKILCTVSLVVVIGVFFAVSPDVSQAQQLRQAPSNPDFVKYREQLRQGRSPLKVTEGGHALGYIPPPIDLSYAKNLPDADSRAAAVEAVTYPATYDLRTKNRVTPVKDQGNCGSCWAFATYASVESKLKGASGTGPTSNYSEQHLNATHGFDWAECDGGNDFLSMAYLGRWSGPVNEVAVPYPYAVDETAAVVIKHIQDVDQIKDRVGFTDNNRIKAAVTNHGALYVSFKWLDTRYNAAKYAYWNNGTTGEGHAVAIIGWNDNYPRTNFKKAATKLPAGNGAFLMKNSWGTAWGNKGYFWMSYYDRSLHTGTSFRGIQATTNYKRSYQYDPLGWVTSLGIDSTVFWGANIFTARADAPSIKAVSFYTGAPNTKVTIYVRKNVSATNPKSGTQVGAALTKTIPTMGYHTVVFSTPKAVTAGKKFSVLIRFNTPGYKYPLPVELAEPDYSSGATASANQSFYSANGSTWTDITTFDPTCNVCIKAFGRAS
ncbi:MAG TPA: lectin like domain-containing protein [Syntrophobacter fumaroxidans]|nr:lectin like domain-containing protein [Syntrophobacter fumaroxidans]